MMDAERLPPSSEEVRNEATWGIEKPKLLLVEGNDEVRLFGALAKHIGAEDVQIRAYHGRDNLRQFLIFIPQVDGYSELESIGITRDADESGDNAARSVRGALGAAGFPVPESPLEPAADGIISVRYLIIPPNGDTGALEDVCLASVSEDPATACVEDYFACIERSALDGPRAARMSKAKVHAFLSSRENPTLRLGEAAERGVWRFDDPAFDPLKSVLRMA